MKSRRIGIAVGFGLVWAISVAMLFALLKVSPVFADGNTFTVCAAGCDYSTIQAAIDAATNGDTIKIAEGTYTHVFSRAGARQIAYISKTITLKGGYSSANWETSDPAAHPTILDAQNGGRGISIADSSQIIIDGISIINGNAAGLAVEGPDHRDGGGCMYTHSADVTLQNTKITSCTAQVGGGIFSFEGAITITQSSITSNTAEFWGGALRSFATTVTVQNSLIAGNVTTGSYSYAGGLYLGYARPAILSNNVISNNTANQFGGGFVLSNSDCTITNNIIANNVSIISNGGGGSIQSDSVCTLNGNTIEGNQAYYAGGGISVRANSNVTFDNNFIENNTAGRHGGGGIQAYTNSSITLTHNIFRRNTSTGETYPGNALAIVGAHAQLWHNNFVDNQGGQDIGISVTDHDWVGTLYTGTLMLTNTIIASQPVGIQVDNGNLLSVDGILWYNVPVTVTQGITAITSIQHQASGNPQFSADGYHIPAQSAARKQGVPSRVTIDIDGEPFLNPPDVGVDQYIFGEIYLPLILRNG